MLPTDVDVIAECTVASWCTLKVTLPGVAPSRATAVAFSALDVVAALCVNVDDRANAEVAVRSVLTARWMSPQACSFWSIAASFA